MASDEAIRQKIVDIADSPANVTLSDIEWVANQLADRVPVSKRKAKHGWLFNVNGRKFMVNSHNPGSCQVKRYSVDDFIDAMTDLGWYEE